MSRERVRAVNDPGHGRPLFVLRQGPVDAEAESTRPPVTHDHAMLAFHTGGRTTLEQGSEWTLGEGDVLLIPAGSPHRRLTARQARMWGVGFCPVCFRAEGLAEELLAPFEHVRSGASAVVNIPEARRPFLESLLAELGRELGREGGGSAPVERGLLTLILAEVGRAASWGARAGTSDSIVTEALRFIERKCLGPLSLKDVAAAVHRSPAHLTTAVREATGRSVQEWIISGRMSEARRRLLHTDELVAVIAERVGYADATHFIRLFRRAHGQTPTAWRARHRPARVEPPE